MSEALAKDIFGRDICKGDLITYPVRYSSSMWMASGYVVEVRKRKGWNDTEVISLVIEGGSSEVKRTISSLNRVVLVEGRKNG